MAVLEHQSGDAERGGGRQQTGEGAEKRDQWCLQRHEQQQETEDEYDGDDQRGGLVELGLEVEALYGGPADESGVGEVGPESVDGAGEFGVGRVDRGYGLDHSQV